MRRLLVALCVVGCCASAWCPAWAGGRREAAKAHVRRAVELLEQAGGELEAACRLGATLRCEEARNDVRRVAVGLRRWLEGRPGGSGYFFRPERKSFWEGVRRLDVWEEKPWYAR